MIVDQGSVGAQENVQQADKRMKVVYSQLGEAEIDQEEPVSIYGVIVDAGYPYKGK
jgi:hypothetical protein